MSTLLVFSFFSYLEKYKCIVQQECATTLFYLIHSLSKQEKSQTGLAGKKREAGGVIVAKNQHLGTPGEPIGAVPPTPIKCHQV